MVHYHLKRGGVTRVIESALRGLSEQREQAPRVVVIAGEVPESFAYPELSREVPGLRYSNAQAQTPSPERLVAAMKAAAVDALGAEPDIWHIHNHSLGKNRSMPGIIQALAESGAALFLQMHDFAEDGRPENFILNQSSGTPLYPDTDRVHYAVINGRDHGHFESLGIPSSKLKLLPNAVEGGGAHEDSDASQAIRRALGCDRLILYPVRAVRRKNFGELLLWAAMAPEGTALATTLGPTNQNYLAAYKRWQALAKEYALPVHFGIGEQHDWSFDAIMQSASAILSTSLAEGFGLAFLEPWLFGKSIIGRDLPAITRDFKADGIQLDTLYESIPIPEQWIDLAALRSKIKRELQSAYAAYGTPLPSDAVDQAIEAIRPGADSIDFAGLDESLQESVLRRVIEDPTAKDRLRPCFQFEGAAPEDIASNAARIRASYGLGQYTETLLSHYHTLAKANASPVNQYDSGQVLSHFLKPGDFRLLRT